MLHLVLRVSGWLYLVILASMLVGTGAASGIDGILARIASLADEPLPAAFALGSALGLIVLGELVALLTSFASLAPRILPTEPTLCLVTAESEADVPAPTATLVVDKRQAPAATTPHASAALQPGREAALNMARELDLSR